MNRILSKAPVRPARPRFWRKGVLAFALACLTLWGSMLVSHLLQPKQPLGSHIYPLDGAAWQGIQQIEFQDLDYSGNMLLVPDQAARIETLWDDHLQPRLQLQRQGDTLIIRPAPDKMTENSNPSTKANRTVSIKQFYLPTHISAIQGSRELRLDLRSPKTNLATRLHLEAEDIAVSGNAPQLQIRLRRYAEAAQDCRYRRYRTPRLQADLVAADALDITAPDGSRIELETKSENAAQLGQIRLQTGEATYLELGTVALWPKITLLPLSAEQTEVEVNCSNKANDNSSPSADDDYSD